MRLVSLVLGAVLVSAGVSHGQPGAKAMTVFVTAAPVTDVTKVDKETETRLLLVNAGMREPEIQFEVRVGRRLVARTDLAYPELKTAIEYEGDGHRRSKEQWRIDIRRQRELVAHGWIVVRLTQADLDDGGRLLLESVRSAFATRRSS